MQGGTETGTPAIGGDMELEELHRAGDAALGGTEGRDPDQVPVPHRAQHLPVRAMRAIPLPAATILPTRRHIIMLSGPSWNRQALYAATTFLSNNFWSYGKSEAVANHRYC
jgi:hypothetical protein